MIRTLLFTGIVTLLLGSCTSKAVDSTNTSKNDSIKKYLDLAGNDTIAFSKRIQYNDKAYSMIDLSKNDSLTFSLLYKSGLNLYKLSKLNELKINSNLMLKKSLLLKDHYCVGLSYKLLGLFYLSCSDNEQALYFFLKAKKFFLLTNDQREIMNVLFNISLTQYYAGDFLGSNETCFEILKIEKKHKSNIRYGAIFNQIGNNLAELKQERKAIEYYQKIDKKKISLNFKIGICNNLSLSYIETGQYAEAYDQLCEIVKNKEIEKINPNSYANALSIFGYCNLRMDNLNNLPKVFLKADYIFNRGKTSNGKNINLIYLSKYYEKIKDTSNAISSAEKALKISKEFKNPMDILKVLQQLIKVDKKNASKNAVEYIRINDSMQIAERKFRDKFAQIVYETNEISQEKDKANKQKWIITSISGFIIVIIILLLIITKQRSKQKELQLKQSQQKANEEIYDLMLTQKNKEEQARTNEKNRIALELHDGVMNKLASTRLNLDVLHHKKDNETIEKCLSHIDEIYQIEQEIRNITHDLTQEAFKTSNSFVALINDFLTRQNATYPTHFILEIEDTINWRKISSSIKMNLFRIIQEACYNINKFAEAENAVVSLILDDTNICLSITDDGKGFDTETDTDGIGLKNIKQRIKNLNGKLVIQSIKDKSTSINIAIPIA